MKEPSDGFSRCAPALAGLAVVLFGLLGMTTAAASELTSGHYAMQVSSQGKGWMVTSLQDMSRVSPAVELYIVAGADGIDNSPLPAGEKLRLLQHLESQIDDTLADRQERIYVVHKQITDSYWTSGRLPEQYEGHAVERCEDFVGQVAESVSPTFPLQHTLPFNQGTSHGDIEFALTVNPQLDLVLQYQVGLTLCVPTFLSIDFFDVDAAVGLSDGQLGLTISSTFEWQRTFKRRIANPRLWSLAFLVGPIPVVINFNLPVELGVDVETGVVGSTTVGVDWSGSFGLDYRCNVDGCSGTPSLIAQSRDCLLRRIRRISRQVDLAAARGGGRSTANPWKGKTDEII